MSKRTNNNTAPLMSLTASSISAQSCTIASVRSVRRDRSTDTSRRMSAASSLDTAPVTCWLQCHAPDSTTAKPRTLVMRHSSDTSACSRSSSAATRSALSVMDATYPTASAHALAFDNEAAMRGGSAPALTSLRLGGCRRLAWCLHSYVPIPNKLFDKVIGAFARVGHKLEQPVQRGDGRLAQLADILKEFPEPVCLSVPGVYAGALALQSTTNLLVPMLFSKDDRRVCRSLRGSCTTVTVASLAV